MLIVFLRRVVRCRAFTAFIHSELEQSVQQVDDNVEYDEYGGKDVQHQV